MAELIIVDLEVVSTLRTDVDTTRSTLREENGSEARTITCGDVDGALEDFMGDWDERRGELADSLDAVSQLLTAIYDSFSGAQDELIDSLDGGGG